MYEILKIRNKKGRIITLTVHKKTATHYVGVDKFGKEEVVNKSDIDSMFIVETGDCE